MQERRTEDRSAPAGRRASSQCRWPLLLSLAAGFFSSLLGTGLKDWYCFMDANELGNLLLEVLPPDRSAFVP